MNTTILEKTKLIEWGVANRPMDGQAVSGDLYVVEPLERGVLVAVVDGVGHGEEAGAAAQKAADILKRHAGESVISLVRRCHAALAETRGAVMTLVSLDAPDDTMTWMGVGNVDGRLLRVERSAGYLCEGILLRNGLVGYQLPALQASVISILPGDLLILATDGIHADFDQGIILQESVEQIAKKILGRNFKGNDDALVLVVRYLGNGK
jgi:negative regulator of sigma-B (phosphoserine phosphatase)